MGRGYGAICNECGERFEVHEGPGMIAMPLHCNQCGHEWWWEFGSGGPSGDPKPPGCECGGTFTVEGPARCPECRSKDVEKDPEGEEFIYD